MPRSLLPLLLAGGLLAACADDAAPQPAPPAPGRSYAAVVTGVTFAQKLGPGVAEGLDLDGRTSDESDRSTCRKVDMTTPDGKPGIDNQFALLLPVIKDLVGMDNIDVILQGAIANGQMLIVLAIDDVQDLQNDDDVTLRIGGGQGAPFLDVNGHYIAYQSFDFSKATPVASLKGRIVNGLLTAGPGDAVLPVRALDANFDLNVRNSRVELKLTPDEAGGVSIDGVLGGGVLADDFAQIISGLNIGSNIVKTAIPLIRGLADLDPDADNACQQISANIKVTSIPAFVIQ